MPIPIPSNQPRFTWNSTPPDSATTLPIRPAAIAPHVGSRLGPTYMLDLAPFGHQRRQTRAIVEHTTTENREKRE